MKISETEHLGSSVLYGLEVILTAGLLFMSNAAVGNDLRYRIARSENKDWNQSQIAYAGNHLYDREEHYAGGITIDPKNTDVVYISGNVDPETGVAGESRRYQIYKGMCASGSWEFNRITFDLSEDNIRLCFPRDHGGRGIVLWMKGRYDSYADYDTSIVGIVCDKGF